MPLYGDDKKRYENNRARERNADVKEIGPPPKIVAQDRRDEGENSLRFFLLTYLEKLFGLTFSAAHERLMAQIESVILTGKRIVVAMPRGSGKTTIL